MASEAGVVMAQPSTPDLPPIDGGDIPDALKAHARWAPWRLKWNERRQKWDKIPCQPNGWGLSTAKPERWLSFEAALAAQRAKPEVFAGVGYVMTGPHGVVGVDLDGCVAPDGTVADWAREVLAQVGGYTELSPSGAGLRVFTLAEVPEDWTNHDIGIEVYAGHEPRFLTVTGQRLPSAPAQLTGAPAGVLDTLARRYARQKSSATVITLALPDLVDELALPDPADLGLPWHAQDFLAEGKHRGDRSRELFATAVALYGAGLAEDEVLSVLAQNPHAMEVALDHRRQDSDRALMYLWVEHAQKAKGRATSQVATAEDFDDVSGGSDEKRPVTPGAAPAAMFDIVPAWQFMTSRPLRWLLKGLLPQADVGAVYGASGSGKSFLVIDMAIHIARGMEWRGFKCKQADVLYVAAEGASGVMQRLRAHADHHGYDMRDVPLMMLGKAPNILDVKQVGGLVASIKARCASSTRLIVIDTLAQTTPGANENSSEDMGRAMTHCQTIAQATGAMVLLVAHAGKDGDRGLRGWSGIKGALDVEILVEKEGRYHGATITKMKDGTNEGRELPFGLKTVSLEPDEDGDPQASAVLADHAVERDKLPPKGKNQQLVLDVLASTTDLAGAPSEAELINLVAAQMPEDKGGRRNRERTKDAIAALQANGRIEIDGGRVVQRA